MRGGRPGPAGPAVSSGRHTRSARAVALLAAAALCAGAAARAGAAVDGPPPDGDRSVRAPGRPRWSFAVLGGSAWNVPTPLTVRQSGQPDVKLTARYDTRPFEDSPYYAFRVGRHAAGRGWEFEFLHHKLYLTNRPDTIERFEITHGFNVFSLNRVFHGRRVEWRAGGGLVIAHPESTVRGLALPGDGGLSGRGYYVAGGLAQGAAGRRFLFGRHFFLAIEGKITLAWVEVPVEDGDASVPSVALHGLAGAGIDF